MKILLTGASSFTGYWFVKELAAQGHDVHTTFRSSLDDYQGIRRERVERLLNFCTPLFRCSFGGPEFLDLCKQGAFDVICHHASEVTNYKSEDFDLVKALSNNTKNIREILQQLKPKSLIFTGSIAERGEGQCSEQNRAFSPYGLSKSFTSEWIQYVARQQNIPFKKFVIPNPFGPYEEERFTTWLIKNWFVGNVPEVRTPNYIRDNIHVSLLAKAYASFVCDSNPQLNPSGYQSTQGEFTQLFASKMQQYLGLPCEFTTFPQEDFPEPKMRLNTDRLAPVGWDEELAWKELAEYYQRHYSGVLA